MSRNMGKRTNTDAHNRIGSWFQESPGLVIRTLCPACGKKKRSGESHPRCSRILQRRRRLGEVI